MARNKGVSGKTHTKQQLDDYANQHNPNNKAFVIVDDKIRIRRNRKKWVIVGNLGAQKEKRNDTPISAKKDIMGDKTVRVRADLHHIIKIETAKNGGNVKEVMEIRLRSKLKSVLIVQYLKILYNRNWS
jgi:hypothetical protein